MCVPSSSVSGFLASSGGHCLYVCRRQQCRVCPTLYLLYQVHSNVDLLPDLALNFNATPRHQNQY